MITENYPFENENSLNNDSASDQPQNNEYHEDMPIIDEGGAEDMEQEKHSFAQLDLENILNEMEKVINAEMSFSSIKKFNQLREIATERMQSERESELQKFLEEGNEQKDFEYWHPKTNRLKDICAIENEKVNEFEQKIQAEQEQNKLERESIITDLHKLYTEADTDTNLFREIRKIKERWSNAGQVPKDDFKILNSNYLFHLNQFYQILDLNKEYLEQEYSHNLEKRKQIIQRAKELTDEPSIQKALNELQFLHKLWKEEAEPVSEEHREETWEEFKAVSSRIHDRKEELIKQQMAQQNENLLKKNTIIEEIKKLTFPTQEAGHTYWQDAIQKFEQLRADFISTGSVPKKLSSENWNLFKTVTKEFNFEKNKYYKDLKQKQYENLEAKKSLLKIAKEHAHATDWENLLPLYKQLQEDWRKIGHVPKSSSQSLWNEFKEACNTFFRNYRMEHDIKSDNWKENFLLKRKILDQLKSFTQEEASVEELQRVKKDWDSIGKVPRDKMSINNEFNQLYRSWAKKLNVPTESAPAPTHPADRARKLKNQIADVENQIVTLENNLNFFSNSSRQNPLLADTYQKIEDKKRQLSEMKESLREILKSN